jgi:hypothetical protein
MACTRQPVWCSAWTTLKACHRYFFGTSVRECPILFVHQYKDVPLNKPFGCSEWITSKACLGGSFFSYTSTRMLPQVRQRAVGIGVVNGPRQKPVNVFFVHQFEDVPHECPIFPSFSTSMLPRVRECHVCRSGPIDISLALPFVEVTQSISGLNCE